MNQNPKNIADPQLVHALNLPPERAAALSQATQSYTVSPLDMVPNPSPQLVETTSEVPVPTPQGVFGMRAWRFADGAEHLSARALTNDGSPTPFVQQVQGTPVPAVRIHSECATGDIFGSYRCDCGPQLAQALDTIAREGGWLVYVRNHEGRGIGLVNKLRTYRLQDAGFDTLDANLALGLDVDMRDYTQAAVILQELGAERIRLVSNNPAKVQALTELGVEVLEMIPDEVAPNAENSRYLRTKRDRMRHRLRTE